MGQSKKRKRGKQLHSLHGGFSSPGNTRETAELEHGHTLLVQAIQEAKDRAERYYAERGLALPRDAPLDLRKAGMILDQYPQLARYLETARQREWARQKASPTGYPAAPGTGRSDSSLGEWGRSRKGEMLPVGVQYARRLRSWADRDEWVSAGINFLAQKVARAEIAVMPADERKPYNKALMKAVQLILDQPNELGESWPLLAGMLVRDWLTIGQGVMTKNMTLASRKPVALYVENAANVKTYPNWSGDPDEPRYLYEPGTSDWGLAGSMLPSIPLRNDEAIVIPCYPTTHRLTWSPIQALAMTIESDLRATESAAHLVDGKSPPHILDFKGANPQELSQLRSDYELDILGQKELLFTASPGGIQVEPLVFSARDNQFLEWQEYLCRKICAVLQISPQDLGVTFQINKATAGSQMEISESKGYLPIMLILEEYLNREFLADFAPKLPGNRANLDALNLRIIFPEITEAARQLHAKQAVDMAVSGLAGLPSMTPNMVLAMMGQEPIPGGNTLWTKTANGAVPFLSYDDDFGIWKPPQTPEPTAPAENEEGEVEGNTEGSGEGEQDRDQQEDTASSSDKKPEASEGNEADAAAGGKESEKRQRILTTKQTRRVRSALPRSYGWTSAMVGFFLDPETAQQLYASVVPALPPGVAELPGDLHMTLAFFGDLDQWPDERVAQVSAGLALFAQQQQPVDGEISGLGRFTSVPEGQPTPLYASVDAPRLPMFRDGLVKALASLGVVPDSNHGFTPHVTLAYLDAGEPMPIESIPALPLHFTGITLAVGDARYTYPLAGLASVSQPAQTTQSSGVTWQDLRQPGKAWSVTSAQMRRSWGKTPAGSVSTKDSAQKEDMTARAALAASLTRVFEDVAARGHQQVGGR